MGQIGGVSTTFFSKERNREPDRVNIENEFADRLVSLLLDDSSLRAAYSLMWVEEMPLSYFVPLLNSL